MPVLILELKDQSEMGNGTVVSEGVSLALDINTSQYVYKNKKNSINDCSKEVRALINGSDFMSQEQVGIKRIPGISIVAAFGLLTMSSSIGGNSFTTINVSPDYYYEAYNYKNNDNTVYNSSALSRQAVGDIVSIEKRPDFVQKL